MVLRVYIGGSSRISRGFKSFRKHQIETPIYSNILYRGVLIFGSPSQHMGFMLQDYQHGRRTENISLRKLITTINTLSCNTLRTGNLGNHGLVLN